MKPCVLGAPGPLRRINQTGKEKFMKMLVSAVLFFALTALCAAPSAWPAEGCCALPPKQVPHQIQAAQTPRPYPLETCIVSGAQLGSMGDPVVLVYAGQEVKLCCAGCVPAFTADPETYLEKIR
jgi:hypothetical protein